MLSNLGLGILHQSHSISDLRLATPEAEGPTGRIHSDIPETKVFAMRLLLSSGSDASYVQSSIEGKLEKQAKGVYAPPRGLPGVVFVDDMGTASRNSSTNTGPTELLRQWIENGGWYEAEEAIFRSLRGLQLMGCFTTGLAGQLSTRLLRHCHLVGVPQLSSASHARIFKVGQGSCSEKEGERRRKGG